MVHDRERELGDLDAAADLDAWVRAKRREVLGPEVEPAWRWFDENDRLPLDAILPSRANLAILRTLWRERKPLWPVQIAQLAGLSRAGTHAALLRLAERRLITAEAQWGGGRSLPFRLVWDHPLVQDLDRLFRTESRLLRPSGIPWSWAAEEGGSGGALIRPRDRGD